MRRKNVLTVLVACAASGLAVTAVPAGAANVASTSLSGVAGAAPVLLRGATDLGRAPQRTEHATLALALRDRPGLDALLATPGHATLTPAQFTDRFGPAPSTTQAATAWAHAAGLAVTGMSPNRTLVSVSPFSPLRAGPFRAETWGRLPVDVVASLIAEVVG